MFQTARRGSWFERRGQARASESEAGKLTWLGPGEGVARRVCGIFHPASFFFFWLSGGSASSNDFL
jgi:hypothetical protein